MDAFFTITAASGVVVEMGRRYLRQRRLQSATLLVRPWPLRLGQRAKLRFDKRLKKRARVDGMTAQLTCTEEATTSMGKYQKIGRRTRCDLPLDTTKAVIRPGWVQDEWEIEIPSNGLPFFLRQEQQSAVADRNRDRYRRDRCDGGFRTAGDPGGRRVVIGVAFEKERVAVGEFLTGNVHWIGEPDRVASHVVVVPGWSTDGVGNRAGGVGRFVVFPVRPAQRDGDFPFRLLIPYEGPISFAGDLVTVDWRLTVRVDQDGLDESIDAGFFVMPRR